jgi:hypothetical protein
VKRHPLSTRWQFVALTTAVCLPVIAIYGCGKKEEPIATRVEKLEASANRPEDSGLKVKIIDVRNEGGCAASDVPTTLMESVDGANWRFSRCGYYGSVGDVFWWGERK